MQFSMECEAGKVAIYAWIDREATVGECTILKCSPEKFGELCEALARRLEGLEGKRGSVPLDYLKIGGGELDGVIIETHISGPTLSTHGTRGCHINPMKIHHIASAALPILQGGMVRKAKAIIANPALMSMKEKAEFVRDLGRIAMEQCAE